MIPSDSSCCLVSPHRRKEEYDSGATGPQSFFGTTRGMAHIPSSASSAGKRHRNGEATAQGPWSRGYRDFSKKERNNPYRDLQKRAQECTLLSGIDLSAGQCNTQEQEPARKTQGRMKR